MKLPWEKRSRNRALVTAAVAVGLVLLALPFVPSVRRYVLMESM